MATEINTKFIFFYSQVKQLIKLLDKTIYHSVSIEYDAYINRSNFALNLSLKLGEQNVNNLDSSLQYRIKYFVKTRQLRQILLLIKFPLIVAIFLEVYSAIMQTIFVLDEASKKMPSGNLDHKIILDNRDEEGLLVGAFNKIADALSCKNQKNTVLNDRLKAENMRMISKLDLTRKIQHMLLPKNREIKEIIGLDIGGFMEATEEVGEDCYDVLPQKGRVKIYMDEVTGHGWESGILMIMVQTPVRTWLADNEPEQVKILIAINSVIYDNMQRMKFDKNASLALLD